MIQDDTQTTSYLHSQMYLKLGARPYPFAIFVEYNRDWAHGERDKGQERVTPAKAKGFVHMLAGQGQQSSDKGT